MRKLVAVTLTLALCAFGLAAVPPPNIDRAIAAQRTLLETEPNAERWNDLGNLLQLAGDAEQATAAYEQALELDSDLVSAHYNLGLLLVQGDRAHKAIDHFQEVVELEPSHAWAWYQLGALHEGRGGDAAAVRAYARAFALDPRLSFSDVNPQIIDSKLVTQGLLEAQSEATRSGEAPLSYEDPRRVAKLLLPQPPSGAAPAAATDEPAVAAAPAAAAPESAGRVLRPEDLPSGSRVGGVTGTAGDPLRPQIPPPDASYSELLRQQLELQQQQEQLDPDQQSMDTDESGVYVPGVRSSAQLHQRLEPLPG